MDSPATTQWLAQQRVLYETYREQLTGKRELVARMQDLVNYPYQTCPMRVGERTFVHKNEGLQEFGVLYVRREGSNDDLKVLDPNEFLARGERVIVTSISYGGRYVAYATSKSGGDWKEFRIRDVDTGRDFPDVLSSTKAWGVAWLPDDSGFFYNRFPTNRGDMAAENSNEELMFHRVGTAQSEDVKIYDRPEQPDLRIFPYIVTHDGKYLLFSVAKGTDPCWETWIKDLSNDVPPRKLLGADAIFRYIWSTGDTFYFFTNAAAPRARVIAIDINNTENVAAWREIVPEQEAYLNGTSVMAGHLVLSYTEDVCEEVKIFTFDGTYVEDLPLPEFCFISGLTGRFDQEEIYFSYTSGHLPSSHFRYRIGDALPENIWNPPIKIAADQYTTTRIFYQSKDGTSVPMFLIHRKDMPYDGSNRTLLVGYGGFGSNMTPEFSSLTLLWCERGGAVALPCLRGGSEYGEEWHQAGTLKRKQNTFDDFIAAAEWLIASKITTPSKLAINGISNGGLLVGAVLNQRPDLFGACIPEVGVMDMIRYPRFTIGKGWIPEYGDPADPEQFNNLLSYSPLHTVVSGIAYPATLICAADSDDRVVPLHSYKYAATLQRAQGGTAPILIRVEANVGHGAGTTLSRSIDALADKYLFLEAVLG